MHIHTVSYRFGGGRSVRPFNRRMTARRHRPASRLGMLIAVAMLLSLSGVVVAAPSAKAADRAEKQRCDGPPHMQGPICTFAEAYRLDVWDPDEEQTKTVGRIRIKTDIHNPMLFVGYWVRVDVHVIANNVIKKTFSEVAMACAWFDPCGNNKFYDRTEPLPLKYLNEADDLRIDHVQLPGRP